MKSTLLLVALLLLMPAALPVLGDEPAAEAPIMRDAACGQVLVSCVVDGVPLRLLLDTGATHTVIDRKAAVAKLPNARKVDTSGMQFNSGSSTMRPDILLVNLQAGGRDFSPQPVLVLPLDGMTGMLHTPVDGILGMDVLKYLTFTLDFREGCAGSWSLPRDGEMYPLKAHPDAGFCPLVTLKTGDKELANVLLDSGSSATVLAVKDWPAGVAETRTAHVADVNGARAQGISVGTPAAIELAPGLSVTVRPQLAESRRPDAAGLLGVDALRGLRLAYSPERGFYLVK